MPVEVGSAVAMLARCFRHQHPEAYGLAVAEEGIIPSELRYGGGADPVPTGPVIAEEPTGNPDAVPLDAPLIVIAGTYP